MGGTAQALYTIGIGKPLIGAVRTSRAIDIQARQAQEHRGGHHSGSGQAQTKNMRLRWTGRQMNVHLLDQLSLPRAWLHTHCGDKCGEPSR